MTGIAAVSAVIRSAAAVPPGLVKSELSEEGKFSVDRIEDTARKIIGFLLERKKTVIDVSGMNTVGTDNDKGFVRKPHKGRDIRCGRQRRRIDQNIVITELVS